MDLDPRRYVRARLADASHKLPFRGRFFGENADDPGFETVDTFTGLDAFLLNDGSIVPAPKAAAPSSDPLHRDPHPAESGRGEGV